MERTGLKRDAAHVEREYNQEKWPSVRREIEAAVAREGEGPQLSRVLSSVARTQWFGEASLAEHEHIFGGREATVPTAVAFGGQSALVREHVLASCLQDTDLIIELGAGWSWHLFSAWVGGGPRSAVYVAAEYTESGRRASAQLADLDPALDFRAIEFDYREPTFDSLDRGRHAVLFTQHSIEQVAQVPESLFDAIRSVADRVSCIHFEPVGWQAEQRDRTGSSRSYAEQHDYNRNLVDALRKQEAAGLLEIDELSPEVVGVNPRNATTVARWHA